MQTRACPKCHALQARRIKQGGFWQQTVLRRLGFYPWECRFCKENFVLKDRGLKSKTHAVAGAAHTDQAQAQSVNAMPAE